MTESAVYDIPISEVAKILDKSDRQIRRYVKERRLMAKPVRVDGHVKLMFARTEVDAFKEMFTPEGIFAGESKDVQPSQEVPESEEPISVDVIDASPMEESQTVKYVIDVLKDQIDQLRKENNDLHYQLEQRSGQVGFLQGQIESLQAEVKMLMPMAKPDTPARAPWYKRMFAREKSNVQEVS